MRRRDFITLLGGAAAGCPLGARAQVSSKRPLVGVISAVTRPGNPVLSAFVQGLRELGYVEGQNIDIAWRFAGGPDGSISSAG
jgi:putative ABC transport system substrate-binding protein